MSLLAPDRQLLILSGKGGVGKTTLTCALTRQLAQSQPERKILLISTDPAHSLGDVLGIPITDQATSPADLPNLAIRALDAEALLKRFKATYGEALELLTERGSWFEREDLLPVWDLAWPGVDELMAILEVNRLLASGDADQIILDTAPTGHTLRLLELPDFLDNILGVFSLFQAKHQEISRTLTGSYRSDQADAFLATLKAELAGGKARLTDPASTAAWLVMIPEALSLAETERFDQQLQARRVPIAGILVNQVLLRDPQSPQPMSAVWLARQQEQQPILHKLVADLCHYPLWLVPFQTQEPLGSSALDALVGQIRPLTREALQPLSTAASLSTEMPADEPSRPDVEGSRLPDLLAAGISLVITGGKGGVGKTTMAGTLAWSLARRHPERRVLVVSIDPAHSLGDLFQTPLGQIPISILPNLWAQEVDAEVILQQFRHDYLDDIVAILAGESGSVEVQYDPQAWKQLLEMPPPGLDEVMALLTVLQEAGGSDLVVLDTAPTGHLLRFLQMPEALEGWVSLALKLWLKYRDQVGRPELAQRLRGLLKQVRGLRDQLQDPTFVTFIPILNPEQAVLAETTRLLQALDHLGIPHPYLVINRIWLDSSDGFGQSLQQRHQRMLRQIAETLPEQAVIPIPFLVAPTLEHIASYLCEPTEKPR